jgi:hypothetical protein
VKIVVKSVLAITIANTRCAQISSTRPVAHPLWTQYQIDSAEIYRKPLFYYNTNNDQKSTRVSYTQIAPAALQGDQRGMANKTERRQTCTAVFGLSEQGGCNHHLFLRRKPKWCSREGAFGVQKHHGQSLTGHEGPNAVSCLHQQAQCRASKFTTMVDVDPIGQIC